MNFEIVGEITNIEAIAVGRRIRILPLLLKRYRKHIKYQFAICVETDDSDLLTPRKIYRVLPDEDAKKSNYVRIIDNEGEDYLYPAGYFVFVEFPAEVEQALLRVSEEKQEKIKK